MTQLTMDRIAVARHVMTANEIRTLARTWPAVEQSMHWWASLFTKDRDHRADLIQEAQVKVWESDHTRFDPQCRQDVAYLRRIAIHRMCDVWGVRRFDPDEDIQSLTFNGERLSDLIRREGEEEAA